MSVGSICQRDVDVVDQKSTVFTAAERMRHRTVGCLVVIDRANCPSASSPTATWSSA
jgi:predicted transcriptional regulator